METTPAKTARPKGITVVTVLLACDCAAMVTTGGFAANGPPPPYGATVEGMLTGAGFIGYALVMFLVGIPIRKRRRGAWAATIGMSVLAMIVVLADPAISNLTDHEVALLYLDIGILPAILPMFLPCGLAAVCGPAEPIRLGSARRRRGRPGSRLHDPPRGITLRLVQTTSNSLPSGSWSSAEY